MAAVDGDHSQIVGPAPPPPMPAAPGSVSERPRRNRARTVITTGVAIVAIAVAGWLVLVRHDLSSRLGATQGQLRSAQALVEEGQKHIDDLRGQVEALNRGRDELQHKAANAAEQNSALTSALGSCQDFIDTVAHATHATPELMRTLHAAYRDCYRLEPETGMSSL